MEENIQLQLGALTVTLKLFGDHFDLNDKTFDFIF